MLSLQLSNGYNHLGAGAESDKPIYDKTCFFHKNVHFLHNGALKIVLAFLVQSHTINYLFQAVHELLSWAFWRSHYEL